MQSLSNIAGAKEIAFNENHLTSSVKWKGRIVVIWSGLGEYAWAKRIENACKNLGWECFTSIDPAEWSEYDQLVQDKPSTVDEVIHLIETADPDCVISLKWDRIFTSKYPNYLSATGVFEHVINPAKSTPKSILGFKGILNTTDVSELKKYFLYQNVNFHSMEWFPSSSASEYEPVMPKAIFYCGFQWDKKRDGMEYRKMFSLLDKTGNLNIYGPLHKWGCAANSVKGMTFDELSFRKAMRASGIVLVLHTNQNIALRAPAARVFEAAAACCVIISDKHPFVMQEFGDSVLYVHDTESGEDLYQQIENHRRWILEHPIQAQAMTKKAHEIFSKKFTLEKQLTDFKKFHLAIHK